MNDDAYFDALLDAIPYSEPRALPLCFRADEIDIDSLLAMPDAMPLPAPARHAAAMAQGMAELDELLGTMGQVPAGQSAAYIDIGDLLGDLP